MIWNRGEVKGELLCCKKNRCGVNVFVTFLSLLLKVLWSMYGDVEVKSIAISSFHVNLWCLC